MKVLQAYVFTFDKESLNKSNLKNREILWLDKT